MQWLINAANQCCAYASGGGRLHLKKVETVSAPFLKCRLQWLQPGYFSVWRNFFFFLSVWDIVFLQRFLCEGQSKEKKLHLEGKSLHTRMYLWIAVVTQANEVFRGVQMVHPKMVKDCADAITYALLFIAKINILYIKPFKNIKIIFY